MDRLQEIFLETITPSKPKKSKAKPSFKPSALGTPCLRKLFYSYNRVLADFPFPVKAKKTMLVGTAIHEAISDIFRKSGTLIDYMLPNGKPRIDYFTKKPNYEFELVDEDIEVNKAYSDMIVEIDGEIWLVELKSINKRGLEFVRNTRKPKPDHLLQAYICFFIFNKMLKNGKFKHIKRLDKYKALTGLKVMYVERDSLEDAVFSLPITGLQDLKPIVQKMAKIKSHTKAKTLPPKTDFFCSTCEYRTKCKKDQIS